MRLRLSGFLRRDLALTAMASDPLLAPEIERHYHVRDEHTRLAAGVGELERLRTQEILSRYLPDRAVVLDVGGGTGPHARWLAEQGHEVHLVDAVERHVEKARSIPEPALASIEVGDARVLDFDDDVADVVLLLGPLYHLTERDERVQCVREAARVLRPGGVCLVAAISRFASALDGLASQHLDDPAFAAIVEGDLEDGRHRNPEDHPRWFTTAYFHRPEELSDELEAGGLVHEGTFGVEGPTWILRDFEAHWDDEGRRARLLELVRKLEAEPSLLGSSAHLLGIGRKA